MKPQVCCWWTDGHWIFVHFEHIGSRHDFNTLIGAFKSEVRPKIWDGKAWRLPLDRMEALVLFVNEHLGEGVLVHKNQGNQPVQHELNLIF